MMETCQLGRNPMSFSCKPCEPVSRLNPTLLVIKYRFRSPPFHSPPEQPTITTFMQILIFWNAYAKFKNPTIKSGCPKIHAVLRAYYRKAVMQSTSTVDLIDPSLSAVARRRRVEEINSLSRLI